jgi:hypothetical protein
MALVHQVQDANFMPGYSSFTQDAQANGQSVRMDNAVFFDTPGGAQMAIGITMDVIFNPGQLVLPSSTHALGITMAVTVTRQNNSRINLMTMR